MDRRARVPMNHFKGISVLGFGFWIPGLLLGLGMEQARAQFQGTTWSLDPAAYRISNYRFELDGRLHPVPPHPEKGVVSMAFGVPITNLVLTVPSQSEPGDPGVAYRFGDPEPPGAGAGAGLPVVPLRRHLRCDRWTTEHGLAGNKIRALLQTRDGYLWIGTETGLTRFDGVRFQVIDAGNTPGMPRDAEPVRALVEDDAGRIWIGMERGLLALEAGGVAAFDGDASLRSAKVNGFARRIAGGFWVATDRGVGFWDGRALRGIDVPGIGRPTCLAESQEGRLWIGSQGALHALDPATGRLTSLRDTQAFGRYAGHELNVYGLMFDQRGRPWIGWGDRHPDLSHPSSDRVDLGAGMAPAFLVPENARFTEDRRGDVWATVQSGPGGVICFSDVPGRTAHLPLGLGPEATSCILHDREGSLWVGGWQGLTRLKAVPFSSLQLESRLDRKEFFTASVGTDGSVWFGGDRCIAHLRGRELRYFDLDPLASAPTAICDGPFQSTWVGLRSGGILQIPTDRRRFSQPFEVPPRFRELGEIHALHRGRGGDLWISSESGLHRMAAPDAVRAVPGFDRDDGICLLEDPEGTLWIGTRSGDLIELGPAGLRIHSPDAVAPRSRIGSLCRTPDGKLWLGTGRGVLRFAEGIFSQLGPDSGVPQSDVYGLAADDFGRLWFSHATGVSRVAAREIDRWLSDSNCVPSVAHLGSSQGVAPGTGRSRSQPCVRTPDGRLWFVRRGGVGMVDPSEIALEGPAPQVWLEAFLVGGEEVPLTQTQTQAARLPPGGGRHLEFRFTTTSLHSPAKVLLRYRLEGHEATWNTSGSERRASYTRLPPGNYTFRVQARNHEGRWSERDALLTFRIAPHLWQTPYFYPAGAGAAAVLVVGWAGWRLKRQRRRLDDQRRQALEHERLRIARDLHDHLGAFLAETALTDGMPPSARHGLHQSLDELGDLIWLVSPHHDTLGGWGGFVSQYSSRVASAAGLALDLEVDLPNPSGRLDGTIRHEWVAMLKEILRNVLQHSGATRVSVHTTADPHNLTLSVRDDGRGFEPTRAEGAEGTGSVPGFRGNGLANLRDRSERLGGSCRIESAPGRGTLVEITAPWVIVESSSPRRWFGRF